MREDGDVFFFSIGSLVLPSNPIEGDLGLVLTWVPEGGWLRFSAE